MVKLGNKLIGGAKMKLHTSKQNKIYMINTGFISENPNQPRNNIDSEKLSGLIQSIRKNGILQPLCVRKINKTRFELIYGHRRLSAAKALEMRFVPCLISNISDKDSCVFSLIENIQRENLNFIEEAKAIDKLIKEYGFTQAQAALHLGIKQPTIANKLRILKLSERQIERIENFSLTERHARALLRLSEPTQRDDILSEIIVKNLNVEQTEKLIDNILKPIDETPKAKMIVKDLRLFVNSINKAINVMKSSGIKAKSEKEENENFIKYIVTINKK